MLLLSMAAGASAKIITSAPKADTPYKIKCIATDHIGYLGDDGKTLQGRHPEGTFFVLEQAADGKEGHYYLKSKDSDKYINAAGAEQNAAITFDANPNTYWTLDQTNANTGKNSWAIRPYGTAGFSLNNNGANNAECPYMKVITHNSSTQGCALWTFDDGLQYDELMPELPEGKYIHVSLTKADRLTTAENAVDNKHWYLLKQARGNETPLYDNGNATLMRAALGTQVAGKLISGNERYLVRFFEDEVEGRYFMQFATGNFITQDLKTGSRATSGTFNFYNINDQDTHFGWNEPDYARIVDNNGPGAAINYWSSGEVKNVNGNNDWSLYAVDFVDGVDIEYTIYSEDGTPYKGSYKAGWNDEITAYPDLAGVAGYTLNSAEFNKDNYSMTANITFPFPVGDNATGIESELGNSKWFVNDDNVIMAGNATISKWNYKTQDDYKWYIYPSFEFKDGTGTFSFKIKHHTGKYIPKLEAKQQATNFKNEVVEEEKAGLFYFMPCIGDGRGFSVDETGTVFLTINSDGKDGTEQPIWTWTKTGTHRGSNLSFPDVTISEKEVRDQFKVLEEVESFEILEGSTVVGPNEFANPEAINAAIAKAKSVDPDDVDAMFEFNNSEDATILKNYLAQVAQYGELHNYQFEFETKQYRTIILPCPATCPAGTKLYSCSEEDGVLTLTDGGNFGANVPYLIEHDGKTTDGKYTIIGWLKPQTADSYTAGCLTGVLKEEGLPIPDNSYKFDFGNQRFVKNAKNADEETEVSPVAYSNESETIDFTCYQHECYLTPKMEADDVLYIKDNGTVSIADIFVDRNGKTEIYDLNGRRLPSLQKGINIVNGHKILVK